jgi:hypothetical protein
MHDVCMCVCVLYACWSVGFACLSMCGFVHGIKTKKWACACVRQDMNTCAYRELQNYSINAPYGLHGGEGREGEGGVKNIWA